MAFLISRDDLIAQQAQIFDQLRSGSEVCYLLKRAHSSSKFEVVQKLDSGWFVAWDRFREALLLRIATADALFKDVQAKNSFIGYGAPDADGDIDVYPVSSDKRDKVPPTETSPCWKFFIERDGNERFRIPD